MTVVDEKMEAVKIINRINKNSVKIEFSGHTVVLKSAIKYLGMMACAKLSFMENLEYAYQKAPNATAAFAIMLPIIGGSRYC